MVEAKAGRLNQRLRTRKDLLQAAARLMKQGHKPTLDEVAQAALVSRATAYHYTPRVESLLIEASLDLAMPGAEALFAGEATTDPVARVERVDGMLHDLTVANDSRRDSCRSMDDGESAGMCQRGTSIGTPGQSEEAKLLRGPVWLEINGSTNCKPPASTAGNWNQLLLWTRNQWRSREKKLFPGLVGVRRFRLFRQPRFGCARGKAKAGGGADAGALSPPGPR